MRERRGETKEIRVKMCARGLKRKDGGGREEGGRNETEEG